MALPVAVFLVLLFLVLHYGFWSVVLGMVLAMIAMFLVIGGCMVVLGGIVLLAFAAWAAEQDDDGLRHRG